MSREIDVATVSRFTTQLRGAQVAQFNADSPRQGGRTIRGTAIVFDVLSDDLGGYRTMFKRGAVRPALAGDPPIHALIGHDETRPIAYTRNGTLTLTETPKGVDVVIDVAKVSYGDDMLELVRTGIAAEMSFACVIGLDEWSVGPDGSALRTVTRVDEIFEVSLCARGAFPQTSATLSRKVTLPDAPGVALAAAADARRRMDALKVAA